MTFPVFLRGRRPFLLISTSDSCLDSFSQSAFAKMPSASIIKNIFHDNDGGYVAP